MIKLITEFPVECKICGRECKNLRALSQHLQIHYINSYDYTLKYLLNNQIPICKCGCNSKCLVKPFYFSEYKSGHNPECNWQSKYDKDSQEYKNIIEKISNSVKIYAKDNPPIITDERRKQSSDFMKNLYKNNPEEFKRRILKMKETKQKQSELGILQERHWTKKLSKEELDIKLKEIGEKISIGKHNNPKPAWNKGLCSEIDSRVEKWSGENHYKFNPNKESKYTKLFRNNIYRKFILETQECLCFGCGCEEVKQKHSLHHVDTDKTNHKFENLIFVCRSCHTRIHNNSGFKDNFNLCVAEFKQCLLSSDYLKQFINEYNFEII